MNGTPLPLVGSSCAGVIAEGLPEVQARRVSLRQMLTFCTMYRRTGIADLFMNGVPDGFFACLSMSARAFAFYLEGASDEGQATGKSEPFFDAVACNDAEAMKTIADLSPRSWNRDVEYEDDFLYMRFLMDRFVRGEPEAGCAGLVDRYQVVVEGEPDPRLDICRSIVEDDQTSFESALAELIEDRQSEIAEDIEYERMPLDDVNTTAKLWVELLALLRFAEMAGLKVGSHYPLAPDIARDVSRATLPPADAWQRM